MKHIYWIRYYMPKNMNRPTINVKYHSKASLFFWSSCNYIIEHDHANIYMIFVSMMFASSHNIRFWQGHDDERLWFIYLLSHFMIVGYNLKKWLMYRISNSFKRKLFLLNSFKSWNKTFVINLFFVDVAIKVKIVYAKIWFFLCRLQDLTEPRNSGTEFFLKDTFFPEQIQWIANFLIYQNTERSIVIDL